MGAFVFIFAQYFGSNVRLFNDKPRVYTRCKENVKGFQIIVGGLAPAGLSVGSIYYDTNGDDDIGVAALRKFY